jgi:hypothetical protein
MTGEAIIAFATLTERNKEEEDELVKELRTLVRGEIGPFAAPDIICITPSLPMVSCFLTQLDIMFTAIDIDRLPIVSLLSFN